MDTSRVVIEGGFIDPNGYLDPASQGVRDSARLLSAVRDPLPILKLLAAARCYPDLASR